MIKKYIDKRTHLDSSREAWERSWRKQAFSVANIIDFGRRVYNHFLLSFLAKHIDRQVDFLEFGCGTATLGVRIAKNIKWYTGFDIAENALKEARSNFEKKSLTNFDFELRDITVGEFPKKFDLVWSQGLIEHFNDPASVIGAHLQACGDGGKAIIVVPAKYSYHHIWYLLTRPKMLRRFWPWPDGIFISRKMFTDYMVTLMGGYSRYRIVSLKPRILGLLILVIER